MASQVRRGSVSHRFCCEWWDTTVAPSASPQPHRHGPAVRLAEVAAEERFLRPAQVTVQNQTSASFSFFTYVCVVMTVFWGCTPILPGGIVFNLHSAMKRPFVSC
jgi:hypothetical protein